MPTDTSLWSGLPARPGGGSRGFPSWAWPPLLPHPPDEPSPASTLPQLFALTFGITIQSAFYLALFSPPSQSSSPSKARMGSSLNPPYNTSPPDPTTDAVNAGRIQHSPVFPMHLKAEPCCQTTAFRRWCWPTRV